LRVVAAAQAPGRRRNPGRPAALDQTLAEAVDELTGNFAAGVAEYEVVHQHILAMADMLSNGIIGQFPKAFR
jgi:hypothetical protein